VLESGRVSPKIGVPGGNAEPDTSPSGTMLTSRPTSSIRSSAVTSEVIVVPGAAVARRPNTWSTTAPV
jgi:hypothetical protein